MVYITSWQEYQEAAEALYEQSPNDTRYTVKWNAGSAKLVLKITDNTRCLKFQTNSSIFLNRFEALNVSILEKMRNRPREQLIASAPEHPIAAQEGTKVVAPSSVVPTAGGPAVGGVKKKKPKKKK